MNLDTLEICKDSFIEEDLADYYSDLLSGPVEDLVGYIPDFGFEHRLRGRAEPNICNVETKPQFQPCFWP